VFGRDFREVLSAGYGLLTGRIPVSGWYLGRDVFMAVSDRPCLNEKREYLYGANDCVCSGSSNVINDRRSEGKPWNFRQRSASVV